MHFARKTLQLGKTMALFRATSIVVVNALGLLVLGEILSVQAYMALGLVVLGFIVLSMSPWSAGFGRRRAGS
jgi:multidrug transporter EmrE-like cation transporter